MNTKGEATSACADLCCAHFALELMVQWHRNLRAFKNNSVSNVSEIAAFDVEEERAGSVVGGLLQALVFLEQVDDLNGVEHDHPTPRKCGFSRSHNL